MGNRSWYGREDLNLHSFRNQNLNLARLPIPPRPRRVVDAQNATGQGKLKTHFFTTGWCNEMVPVPQGRQRMAHRFIGGLESVEPISPDGAKEQPVQPSLSFVPPGTPVIPPNPPAVDTVDSGLLSSWN